MIPQESSRIRKKSCHISEVFGFHVNGTDLQMSRAESPILERKAREKEGLGRHVPFNQPQGETYGIYG